jgi:hypothetical protein
LKYAISPVIKKVDIFDDLDRAVKQNIEQQEVNIRNITRYMENRKIILERVAQDKKEEAKKTQ